MSANSFGSAIIAGSTGIDIPVQLRKTSDGTGQTGKVAGDMTGSYWRPGGSRVAITLADHTNLTDAWASGKVKEVDATNQKGLYRLSVPDAAFVAGADFVIITIQVASTYEYHYFVPLTLEPFLKRRFTASAGAASTFTIPSFTVATDELAGCVAFIESGTGAGQARTVLSNTNAASPVCSVDRNFTTAPDNTSVIRLYAGSLGATLTEQAAVIAPAVAAVAGSEPSSVPAVNATLIQKIDWLFTLSRNKLIQTATLQTLKADNGSTSIATAVISDLAGTFTREEWT